MVKHERETHCKVHCVCQLVTVLYHLWRG